MDAISQITAAAVIDGIEPALAVAVAEQESGFSPPQQYNDGGVVITGSHGEIGMFQLMPDTAAGLGVDPYDPTQNIQGGVRFLAQMINQFGLPGGLYAYNWGPGNVQAWQAGKAQLPASVANYGAAVLARAGPAVVADSGAQPAPGQPPPSADGNGNIALAIAVVAGLGLLVLVT